MKDIKSYVIGFLTCACLFLIMGQTNSKQQGRYQGYGVLQGNHLSAGHKLYLVDTYTGETFVNKKGTWKEKVNKK